MNRAVYTALFGGYERLLEQPVSKNSSVPFICFTDDPGLTSESWTVVVVKPLFPGDMVRSARALKILGQQQLDEFDETLWIDNSVLLKADPTVILSEGLGAVDIAMPANSFRGTTALEFDAVVSAQLDDPARVSEQLTHYLEHTPDVLESRALWTAIIARRRSEPTRSTMRVWMDHVMRYSRRDQLSVTAALAETGQALYLFEIDNHESDWHRWPVAANRRRVRVEADRRDLIALEVSRLRTKIDRLTRDLISAIDAREQIIVELESSGRVSRLPIITRALHYVGGSRLARRWRYSTAGELPPDRDLRRDLRTLVHANRFSTRSIVDPGGRSVVTMTTHGDRIRTAFFAIEAIGRGTTKPARIVLWLDDPALFDRLPGALRRLRRRGLEVRLVKPGLGVHTKYFPLLESGIGGGRRVVTADDDIVYPPEWLEELTVASDRNPDAIVAHRAHQVLIENGALAPYVSWPAASSTEPDLRNFGTSVSGQSFPPAFMRDVLELGHSFLQSSPDNDDIWLHRVATSLGVKTVPVGNRPRLYHFVPGTQHVGLHLTNVWEGANDRQIAATYDADAVAALDAAQGQQLRKD